MFFCWDYLCYGPYYYMQCNVILSLNNLIEIPIPFLPVEDCSFWGVPVWQPAASKPLITKNQLSRVYTHYCIQLITMSPPNVLTLPVVLRNDHHLVVKSSKISLWKLPVHGTRLFLEICWGNKGGQFSMQLRIIHVFEFIYFFTKSFTKNLVFRNIYIYVYIHTVY